MRTGNCCRVSRASLSRPSVTTFSRLAYVLVLVLSGCATVVNGRTEQVGLSSNPAGAEATVDGNEKVITPGIVSLKRDEPHTVIFHKDGYQDFSATLTPESSGWVWGNILAGGIIGAAVDMSTGAASKLSRDNVTANLTPIVAANPAVRAAQSAATTAASDVPRPAVQPANVGGVYENPDPNARDRSTP